MFFRITDSKRNNPYFKEALIRHLTILSVCLGILFVPLFIPKTVQAYQQRAPYVSKTKQVFEYFTKPNPNASSSCMTVPSFYYKEDDFGVYFDVINSDRFFITQIESQIHLDTDKTLSEDQASYLLYLTYEVVTKEEYKNLSKDKKEELYHMLNNVMIVVLRDEKTTNAFWTFDRSYVLWAAMDLPDYACFKTSPKAKWFMGITGERFIKKDPSTVIHEIMHAVSYVIYGRNFDVDHKNPKLWTDVGKDRSLQSRVLKKFRQYPL
jgi:hypothetical protein